MTIQLLASALVLVMGVGAVSGCTSSPPQEWWDDGSGGSKPVALLSSLDVEGLNCDAQRVAGMTCRFENGGVLIVAERESEPTDAIRGLLGAFFQGTARGTGLTPAAGYVGSGSLSCFMGASTVGAPGPCELELQGIERGEAQEMPTGSGGAVSMQTIEVGSRVRMRVSCPDGLYYPGTDDVPAYDVPIAPGEFALEAQDCVVVDE